MKLRNHLAALSCGALAAASPALAQDLVRSSGTPSTVSNGERPRLQADSLPVLGNSQFGLRVSNLPQETFALLAASLEAGSMPLGTNTLLISLPSAVTALMTPHAAVSSRATSPLPISNDPALQGLELHLQSAILDGAANITGLTNALTITIGDNASLPTQEAPFDAEITEATLVDDLEQRTDLRVAPIFAEAASGRIEMELRLQPVGGVPFDKDVVLAYAWRFRDASGAVVDQPGDDYFQGSSEAQPLIVSPGDVSLTLAIPYGRSEGGFTYPSLDPAGSAASYSLDLWLGPAATFLPQADGEPTGHVWATLAQPITIEPANAFVTAPGHRQLEIGTEAQIFIGTRAIATTDRFVDVFATDGLTLQTSVAVIPAGSNHVVVLANPAELGEATVTAIFDDGSVVTSPSMFVTPTRGTASQEPGRHPAQPDPTGTGYSCSEEGGGDIPGPVLTHCGPCAPFGQTTPPAACANQAMGATSHFLKFGKCYARWVGTNLCCYWSTKVANAKEYKLTNVDTNRGCGFSIGATLWSFGAEVEYFAYCCDYTWTGNRNPTTYPHCRTGLYTDGCHPL